MSDLFQARLNPVATAAASSPQPAKAPRKAGAEGYTAADIEVLEGLEPVRRRPGMYIGGTDARALHHLFAEILDNAVDEAIGGHARIIRVDLSADGFLTVMDDGRGIPVDPHPRFPDKSALEVILTTLHAGGKFGGDAYETSGGLHGVGASVVNALSDTLEVEVMRGGQSYRQSFARGIAQGSLQQNAPSGRLRKGTLIRFHPDPEIFGKDAHFEPQRLFKMAEAKAYLCAGVEIRWQCAPALVEGKDTPPLAILKFPGGLKDRLTHVMEGREALLDAPFAGNSGTAGKHGAVEWALAWTTDGEGSVASFCNTVPTPEGGTHEMALRVGLLRALRGHAERIGHKRFANVTTDDVMRGCVACLALHMREPKFQGQTKEKLASQEATKLVEPVIKDACEHWLGGNLQNALKLLDALADAAEERLRARADRDALKKNSTKRARLPGKLADATNPGPKGLELFIVEGDSAGGSAKQARDRKTQAILPLRGKILNVANAAEAKFRDNQQLQDLILALGTGTGKAFSASDLRYEKVIIMTDADVDGAHIASLLMTFFWQEMPDLIHKGHLYLAIPPLFRLSHGGKSAYARNEAHRDELLATVFKGKSNVEIGRFKGLGEMMPQQLRDTTMDTKQRTLLRISLGNDANLDVDVAVQRLMGSKAEGRFSFIQERAAFAEIDV